MKFTLIGLSFFWTCFHLVLATDWNNNSFLIEFGPKQVNRFNGIGSQKVFHWRLSASSQQMLLLFNGYVNQTGSGISTDCADVNVTIIIRHNAIPVPNPRDSIIPEQTLMHTDGERYSGSFTISQKTQLQLHGVIINESDVGDYFAAAFLPHDLQRIDVAGLAKDCRYYVGLQVFSFNSTETWTSSKHVYSDGLKLVRKQSSLFNIVYMPIDQKYNLTVNQSAKFFWDIYPITDSGGTLNIIIKSFPTNIVTFTGNTSVYGCLRNEFSQNNINCSGDVLQLNNSHLGLDSQWHIPFPVSGVWMLEVHLRCQAEFNLCNNLIQPIELSVSVGGCVDNCHADKKHGSCGIYRTDDILFTACRCKVGWRGIACNDGRDALSYNTQLLHTLLLTLSNLMFLPCVVLAIYRKFYTEALVYFFVAFMSSFYHACDQPGVVVYCLMPYETLQFSDFLGSISAIWFTLVSVGILPYPLESWFHVLGCLGIAVAVSYDRFNVWTTVVPAVVGAIIVVSKWGYKCHTTKECYPGARVALFSIFPGLTCAGVALILFAFVETDDNYYIVHSMWHILMAIAVLFLLPIGPKHKVQTSQKVEADDSSHTFVCNPNYATNQHSSSYSGTSLV